MKYKCISHLFLSCVVVTVTNKTDLRFLETLVSVSTSNKTACNAQHTGVWPALSDGNQEERKKEYSIYF